MNRKMTATIERESAATSPSAQKRMSSAREIPSLRRGTAAGAGQAPREGRRLKPARRAAALDPVLAIGRLAAAAADRTDYSSPARHPRYGSAFTRLKRPRKFDHSCDRVWSLGNSHACVRYSSTSATSHGFAGLPATRTYGPSVSDKTCVLGTRAMISRPFADLVMAGLTESRWPALTICSSVLREPEYQ